MSVPNVDTYHWDAVYVASFDTLNNSIKNTSSFPSEFDYKDTGTGVAIKGNWSDWALSLGGSGKLVQMQATIASGTATGSNETADLAGGTVTIQFQLEQVLDTGTVTPDPTAKPGTGVPTAQRFPQGGPNPVTVIAASFPNAKNAPVLKDLLRTIFQQYFNANLSQIKATFHVMTINEQAAKDDFQWLKPSAVSYAVAAPDINPSLATTAFGALAMTDKGSIGPLQQQAVDIAALVGLADGANSAFVISPEKITEHLLLKGAVSTIQGSTEADFSISDSGLNITTANDLTWGNFKLKDGSIISPRITAGNLLMRMDGDHVHLEITNAAYSPSNGITVYLNLIQDFGFKTVKRESDGKYIFIPDTKSFGKARIFANVQVAEWLKITQIVIGVVASIAALAGGISMLADFFAGAAQVSTSGSQAVIDISADVVDEASALVSKEVDGWVLVNEDAAEDADVGVVNPGNVGQVQTGSFLKSAGFRAFCGITAGIAGLTVGGIAVAGPAIEGEYDKIPPFDDFAANVLGASQFPALQNYELLGAQLRNSLVASIKLS